MKLKWKNASTENPGHSVYYAIPERNPNMLYVIRQKKKADTFKPAGWRVFVRTTKDEPLRTIFMDPKLATAKRYVQDLEDVIEQSTGAV